MSDREFSYYVAQSFNDEWVTVAKFSNGGDAKAFEALMRSEFPNLYEWKTGVEE